MTRQPETRGLTENGLRQTDDFDFIIYLRKLWKWKWLILAVPLGCMAAAAFYTNMLPKIYEVTMIIKAGAIGTKNDGSPIPVDSIANMKGNIENGIFNSKIIEKLNLKSPTTDFGFNVTGLQAPELLRISSGWERAATHTGEKVLGQLYSELKDYYAKVTQEKIDEIDQDMQPRLSDLARIEMERKDLEKQISTRLSNIQSFKEQINFLSSDIKILSAKKTKLIQEIDQIKRSNESLLQQKNRFIEGEAKSNNQLSILLYFLAGQQTKNYISDLNEQLDNLDFRETQKKLQIAEFYTKINENSLAKELLVTQLVDGLQNKIKDVRAQIEKFNMKKSKIENIGMIAEPKTSPSVIRPKLMLNVVLSGVAGFFIAIFAAFFTEYFQRLLRKIGGEKISTGLQN